MEISWRDLITVFHGMGFGALFMLAFTGAIAEIYRMSAPGAPAVRPHKDQMLLRFYVVGMVVLAWGTVISGAYLVYPWYRAIPPAGTADLSSYPQSLLMASPSTSGWHSLGMEWKEHVAFLAPIATTVAAFAISYYGTALARKARERRAVMIFFLFAFAAAAAAGVFGALITKVAPVH